MRNHPVDTAAFPGLAEATCFQRDLYLYWRVVEMDGGLPLTKRRFVTRPALRRIRERLPDPLAAFPYAEKGKEEPLEGEDERLFFLRRLLERLGLLRAEPERLRLIPAPRAEMARYLAHPLARRLRIAARLWVAGGWWPDRPDPRMEPPRLLAPAPPRLAVARRRLLETLAALSPGDDMPVLSSRAPYPVTRSSAHHGRPPRRLPAITGEEEVARAALLGPLAWMGFVVRDGGSWEIWRVGVAPVALAGGLTSQLPSTEQGREGQSASSRAELAEVGGRVVAQANLEIFAYPPLTAPVLATLDTLAEELALGAVAHYRLSRAALGQALRAGWTAERAVAALEALTGADVPGNVRIMLGDWERAAERVRLTPAATVVEAPSHLLDALLADRAAAHWVERRITATAALLVPGGAEPVREWLLRHGEVPAWLRAPEAEGPPPGRHADTSAR